MACCQRHKLLSATGEERIGAGDERARVQLGEGCESGVDRGFGAGLQHMELQPHCARRFLRLSNNALGLRTRRVHE